MILLPNNLAAWSYALSWTIIDSLWQFLIIALVLRLLFVVVSRQQAILRYHLSFAALLLCVGWWLSNLSFHYVEFQNNSLETMVKANAFPSSSSDAQSINHPVISPNSETLNIELTNQIIASKSANTTQIAFIRWINQHKEWFFLLWTVGIILLSVRFLNSWLQLKKLRTKGIQPIDNQWQSTARLLQKKLGISKKITVMLSSFVDEPITFGHLKPIILIPIGLINALSEKEVEAILLHELAHIHRHDFLINIFQNCLEILLFYHPIIRWFNTVIRVNREACCDDLAISIQKDQQLYAATLLHIHKYSLNIQNSLVMTAIGKKGALTQRIHRLFNPISTQKRSVFSFPFVLLFLLVGSLAFLGFQRIQTKPIVSISVDKMNILYYGVENPITIAVEGAFNEDVKVSSNDLTLKDLGDGKYNAFPLKIGKAIIIVETGNMKKELIFEVKKFPTPNFVNIKKGAFEITAEEMKAMKGLELEDLEKFGSVCEVVHYEIIRVPVAGDPIVETSKTSAFSKRILTLVSWAEKGDIYYVDVIKIKCLGDEKPRSVDGLIFKVK